MAAYPFYHSLWDLPGRPPLGYLERTIGDRRYRHRLIQGGGSVLYWLRHACSGLLPTVHLGTPAVCQHHHHGSPDDELKQQPPPPPTKKARSAGGTAAPGTALANVDVCYRFCKRPGSSMRLPVAVLVALVDIKAGDELCLDFQRFARSSKDLSDSDQCKCRSIFCRQRIVGWPPDTIWWPVYRFERVRHPSASPTDTDCRASSCRQSPKPRASAPT